MNTRPALTIGTFDGVHVGHAAILRAARKAVPRPGIVMVLSFDPSPGTVLDPSRPIQRLTSRGQRTQLLIDAGADEVLFLDPRDGILDLRADSFLKQVCRTHNPAFLVEGEDFRFGQGRKGSMETLRMAEERYGYETVTVAPVQQALQDGLLVPVSSSLVRRLLLDGRVVDAAMLLGHPYAVDGTVVPGEKRGRTLGIPTANLEVGEMLLPRDGIYAGSATRDDGRSWAAAISIGRKPTFDGDARWCEAHLLGYDGPPDEYDWSVTLQFTSWIRDQVRFETSTALVEQMERDIAGMELRCE